MCQAGEQEPGGRDQGPAGPAGRGREVHPRVGPPETPPSVGERRTAGSPGGGGVCPGAGGEQSGPGHPGATTGNGGLRALAES